jgi:hypothetical protein
MAQTRHHQTLGDYVTIAISPILIMAMVGSLVYFLLEVLYVGKYEFRLQWILFCFVFGIVLVARMSMRDDLSAPWGAYGLVLGFVVWVAICRFVQFDPDTLLAPFSWLVNAGLMAIVWWSAHQLTWDCTHIDDQVDASGVGLMQAAGLEDRKSNREDEGSRIEDGSSSRRAGSVSDRRMEDQGTKAVDGTKRAGDLQSSVLDSPVTHAPGSPQSSGIHWWERFRRYREAQWKKPHNPGVWVIYFSLAALPLFGLGQSLIPAEDEGRRRYVFWLMIVYLGSGLGLLLTTSFLGLRRYLRQRKLPMPKAIAGAWLTTGGLLIAGLLVVGTLLPRPNAEYPLIDVGNLVGSKDRQASRYASKGDSPGKGQGRASTDRPPENEKAESGSGNKPDKQGGNQSQGKSGQQKGDSKSDQKGTSKGNQKEKSGSDKKSEGESKDKSDKEKQKKDKGNSGRGSDSEDKESTPKSTPSFHTSIASWLSSALKWIVFAVLAIVVAFYLFRHGLKYLSNFTAWARRLLAALDALWQRLFGWWEPAADSPNGETESRIMETPPVPFSSFANPFRDGSSGEQSPEELVRYSFEALEAWGREHELPRTPEETALEFARRIGHATPGLDADVKRLAGLYAHAAYGRGRLTPAAIPTIREFWERLEGVTEAPLSA